MTITDQDKIKLLDGFGLSRVISQIKKWVTDNFFQKTGGQSLPVENGGTGVVTLTENGVVLGNGTNAVKTAASASGALYSTGNGAEPQFGVLPFSQGGIGQLSAGFVPIGTGNDTLNSVKSTNANEANTIVMRDGSKNFSAGTITANLTGVASKATAANISTRANTLAYYSNSSGTFANLSTDAINKQAVYYNNAAVTLGTLPVQAGGTGATTLPSGALLQGNGTNAVSAALSMGGPIQNGFQTMYINESGKPTPGVKILYGSSLPTFDASTYPAGTIFVMI